MTNLSLSAQAVLDATYEEMDYALPRRVRWAAAAALDLTQPESVVPTDEELYELWEESGFESDRFARAVLARWGRPTPQPVAVSERLPGAGDCDEEGRCWLSTTTTDPGWVLDYPKLCTNWTHWLPANALPTPEATNG